MLKFIIAGLPRSGTTWLSVFLTTDNCVVLHDPTATYFPDELSEWSGGIADTGIWFYDDWCKNQTDKFILVKRDVIEVNKELQKYSFPTVPDFLMEKFNSIKSNYTIDFNDIFKEDSMKNLWEYIYPNIPFNVEKYEQFRNVYMSPIYMEK